MVKSTTRSLSREVISAIQEFDSDPIPRNEDISRFRAALLRWFSVNRREMYWRTAEVSNYVKIVSEVLLQRTQAAVVSKYLPKFIQAFPNWEAIAEASEDELGELLRPLGLWRRRAISLSALAREISRRNGIWPETRHELESIPAVGQYVASAVLMFEHNEREPLMDATMARVLRRYFALTQQKVDIRYDKLLLATAYAVLREGDAVAINWAILDFGSIQCRNDTEGCESCSLKAGCKRYTVVQNPAC